jgi:hypothetical protein
MINKVLEAVFDRNMDAVDEQQCVALYPDKLQLVDKIRTLCRMLGLANTNDGSLVRAATLDANEESVCKLVDELFSLMKLRTRAKKATEADTVVYTPQQKLRSKLGSVLRAFGRGEVKTERIRSHQSDNDVSKYNFRICCRDDFVCKLMVLMTA